MILSEFFLIQKLRNKQNIMNYRISPKSLILSMMLVSDQHTLPIKALVDIGNVFGFSSNTIRVTTTRLIREGRIESDERGLYRLSDQSTPFSRYLDNWRLGEERLKPWDGRWICCLLSTGTKKQKMDAGKRLRLAGFREGYPNLFVRPNNLSLDLGQLRAVLAPPYEEDVLLLFVSGDFETQITDAWRKDLWDIDTITRIQSDCLVKLEKSMTMLGRISIEEALEESYLLGSEAVHLLVNDPLLPQEFMSNQQRSSLTRCMLSYDEVGKSIWTKRFSDLQLQKIPSQLQI